MIYTAVPLSQDVEITGHPVCHLWISSTAQAENESTFIYIFLKIEKMRKFEMGIHF
ncbi:hypothetical protein KGY73_00525 [bacterium]|nr:hypothetical protein [bacterium]